MSLKNKAFTEEILSMAKESDPKRWCSWLNCEAIPRFEIWWEPWNLRCYKQACADHVEDLMHPLKVNRVYKLGTDGVVGLLYKVVDRRTR